MKNFTRFLLIAALAIFAPAARGQVSVQVRDASGSILGTFNSGTIIVKCDTTMTCTVSGVTILMSPNGGTSPSGNILTFDSVAVTTNIINFDSTNPTAGGGANVIWNMNTGATPNNISAYLPTCVASGSGHKPGGVPDPGGSAGTSRWLREDCTWQTLPSGFYQQLELNAGSPFTQRPTINFLSPFTVADNSGNTSTDIGITLQYQTVQNAGSNVTQRAKLNFPAPMAATDDSGNGSTDISVNPMVGSGTGHAAGLAPDPGGSSGGHRVLGEDGSWDAQPYDVGMYYGQAPTASQIILALPFTRSVTFPSSLTGSQTTVQTVATSTTVLTLNKNGSSIGSVSCAASASTCTFTFSSAVTFTAGDILTVVAPVSPDATFAGFGMTLAGVRN